MEKQTIAILEECCKGCKMAVDSMNQISEYVYDEKLKKIIFDSKKKHMELEEKAIAALNDHQREEKEPGVMASTFSKVMTDMKMMMKDDSRQVAKLMMDGCNMGIQSIMEVLHTNPGADKKSKEIAKEIIAEEEKFVEAIKPFL